MEENGERSIKYGARDLTARVVSEFARGAGYMMDVASLAKAKRELSRCLSRALYELTSKEGRERWSFRHKEMTFHVLTQDSTPVRVVRVLSGGSSS